jgi:hypothetical protein
MSKVKVKEMKAFWVRGLLTVTIFSFPLLSGERDNGVVASEPQVKEGAIDVKHAKAKEKTLEKGDIPRIQLGVSPFPSSGKSGSEEGASGD